ncbi:MAG: PQQ-dependent sugar dehydrogenase [Polyangiales bacterium]
MDLRTAVTGVAFVGVAALLTDCTGGTPATGFDAGVTHPERPALDRDPTRTYWCDLPAPDVPQAGLPFGFCIRRYASLRAARVMAVAPGGELFVSSPSTPTPGGAPIGVGGIVVLSDDDRDGVAETHTFASGMPDVHGLLFVDGWLYFTRGDGVYRTPYARGQRAIAAGSPQLVTDLRGLSSAARWTHTLARAADGTIYVSQGQYYAFTCPTAPREGAIYRVDPSSTTPVFVSGGYRNPLFLRCDPSGARCYAAELSDDGWDPATGTLGREKLVVIRDGEDYGYPCCAGRDALGPPGRSRGASCASVAQELRTWPLHDTPFGIDFERGNFPEPWRGGFFVGLHGAFASWENTKLEWSPVDRATGQPTGEWRDFVTGWGRSSNGVVGRVTDVTFAPDGRLFFTDDQGGGVYWVSPEEMSFPR